jgi:MerR family transcriptional regulator, light-induced transcriptional regulator
VSGVQRRASDGEWTTEADRFLDALRAGSATAAEAVVAQALRADIDPAAIHSRVIEPAMNGIGELWQLGEITVADEHLATAICHEVLARLFPRLMQAQPRAAERVILAAAEGEHHVLGLRMVADVLEGAGFDVLYLGADVAGDELLSECGRFRPAVVGLTATIALNVPGLIWALIRLQTMVRPPAVLLGGGAVGPALDRGLGVTRIAHSDGVVATVERVLQAPPPGPIVPDDLARRIPPLPASRAGAAEAGPQTELPAYHDSLTGLWNQRAYGDRLSGILAGQAHSAVVLWIDVDGFKAVNDRYGDSAGDRTLAAVARSIVLAVRPSDFVARVGGGQFAIMLPGATGDEGVAVAGRVQQAIREEVTDPPSMVSVGVAPVLGSSPATSLAVDHAMHDAKESGGNGVVLIEPGR